jgi:hypothetical protein
MAGRMPGFFDIDERLRELSAKGDDLERINELFDFEMLRPDLEAAVPRAKQRTPVTGNWPMTLADQNRAWIGLNGVKSM